jgi:hypothetical protein
LLPSSMMLLATAHYPVAGDDLTRDIERFLKGGGSIKIIAPCPVRHILDKDRSLSHIQHKRNTYDLCREATLQRLSVE